MPRLHIVQILGVIDNEIPSSFDLPPASLERNAEILDLPAWKSLHAGESAAAYAAFKSLAPDAANSSAAMVGYAIAAAEQKKLHVAGFALRQAFENDPEGAASMTLTFDLQKRVRKLAQRAAVVARQYGDDYADSRFLHAAFNALAQDDLAARQAIDKVIAAGDRSESAQNLRDAVSLELDSPMLAEMNYGIPGIH
jgi:phage-related tail fiber protein